MDRAELIPLHQIHISVIVMQVIVDQYVISEITVLVLIVGNMALVSLLHLDTSVNAREDTLEDIAKEVCKIIDPSHLTCAHEIKQIYFHYYI